MKKILWIAGSLLLGLPAAWLIRNSRAFTETVPYQLVRAEGAFELRDYPALTLATTPMNAASRNGSFGRLFGFITGKNAKQEQIPMTAPVLIDPATGTPTMSFVMPPSRAAESLPQPRGEVTLKQTEPGRYAVYRFPGSGTEANQQAATEKLRSWLHAQGIPAEGEPIFAYYDPPWTPVPLRRNEVLLRVAKEAGSGTHP